MGIVCRSKKEIEQIRRAGGVAAMVLREIGQRIAPGMTTGEICDIAEEVMRRHGGEPVFQPETGFPAPVCTSVNEEVVHGVPGKRKLREGDIVSVDVGVRIDGYIGDTAVTLGVGEISPRARRLLETTRGCLEQAIRAIRPGGDLAGVSRAVQAHAERDGFSVVRDFVGHGVGEKLHEPPQVPNFVGPGGARPGKVRLRPGTVIAIEPMVNEGTWRVRRLPNEWTVVTADGKLSAHFEHTVAVGEDGPKVLTLS